MNNRLMTAQYIAAAATALTVIGVIAGGMSGSEFGLSLINIGIVAGFISYFFGGIRQALRMSVNIARWGWVVVPFPFGIFGFVITLWVAILCFVALPIIPVRKAYKESMQQSA